MSGTPVKRQYDNSTRAEQRRETRRRVLAAARDAFIEQSFSGTTMRVVADRAGVSVETIYKSFGSKGGLARAVVDAAIAGDDEQVAIVDRPVASEIAGAPDAGEMLRRYARHARGIYERLGPLTAILLGARAGDDELLELRKTADEQRLHAASLLARALKSTGQLRPELDEQRIRDVIWALNSPELHTLVVLDRRWSPEEYEEMLIEHLTVLVVGGTQGTADRPGGRRGAGAR